MTKKLISIVTPVFNEEDNIHYYFTRMQDAIRPLQDRYDFEIVLTDNASTDNTFSIISDIALNDASIRAYRLSRNFGYQKSILTGLSKAKGDVAIEFDCDLQDPPELLPVFLKAWEDGAKVVYGIRLKRQEGPFVTGMRRLFYRLINRISEYDLPADAGDFMMLDRIVLDQLKKINDQDPYLRGIIFSLGYTQCGIPYERDSRKFGNSKFSFRKMFGLALDGIISQSDLPLRIASYTGLLISIFTTILSGYYLLMHFVIGEELPPGFTTTVILILFSISLNAIFLGIIGEYIARIYRQVRYRPLSIISQSVNDRDEVIACR
ncbi:MAG: glycosyltransferase family 2 protein [Candidatus Thiodiazotropha sp.]|jgi:polyisoprenyl-phosphate glycosyltransferase